MKRYPAYKDSGVEWLGEVPEGWDVRPVKTLFEIRKRIAGELGHNVLSVTQRGLRVRDLGSKLIDRQSQNMTVAASATADRKVLAHLS